MNFENRHRRNLGPCLNDFIQFFEDETKHAKELGFPSRLEELSNNHAELMVERLADILEGKDIRLNKIILEKLKIDHPNLAVSCSWIKFIESLGGNTNPANLFYLAKIMDGFYLYGIEPGNEASVLRVNFDGNRVNISIGFSDDTEFDSDGELVISRDFPTSVKTSMIGKKLQEIVDCDLLKYFEGEIYAYEDFSKTYHSIFIRLPPEKWQLQI